MSLTAGMPGWLEKVDELLANIKANLEGLEQLLNEVSGEWVYDDLIYRFWHHSFKVYMLQEHTTRIAEGLGKLCPEGVELHPWYHDIVASGTGARFELSHNQDWLAHTKPIVDAFLHSKYLLEMVVSSGQRESGTETYLSSRWAAVLELYQLR
jgi:hypothetical protein